MKILMIFLFLFLLSMTLNVSLDMLTGVSLKQALQNLLFPYTVKTGSEVVTTIILIFIWVAIEVSYYIQEQKANEK